MKGLMEDCAGRAGAVVTLSTEQEEPVKFYHAAQARETEGRKGAAKAQAGHTCPPSAMSFHHLLTPSVMKARGENSSRQVFRVNPTTCRPSFCSQSLSKAVISRSINTED